MEARDKALAQEARYNCVEGCPMSIAGVPGPQCDGVRDLEATRAFFSTWGEDFARRFVRVCDGHELTQRERETIFYAVHGYTIDATAEKLTVSRETVKSNLARAYSRAGVNGKQAFLALMDRCA